MKRRILGSLLVIAVVTGLVSASTFALFDDTETSSGNTFQAGTLDLELGSPSDLPISLTNMAPGVESEAIDITWTNVGSLPGELSWNITAIADNDGAGSTEFGGGDVGPYAFARELKVTQALFDRNGDGDFYDTREDVTKEWGSWCMVGRADGAAVPSGCEPYPCPVGPNYCSDCPCSLYDMMYQWDGSANVLRNWGIDDSFGDTDRLDPGHSYRHQLKFTLDSDVGNEFQAEGIEVTVTVTLNQYNP